MSIYDYPGRGGPPDIMFFDHGHRIGIRHNDGITLLKFDVCVDPDIVAYQLNMGDKFGIREDWDARMARGAA